MIGCDRDIFIFTEDIQDSWRDILRSIVNIIRIAEYNRDRRGEFSGVSTKAARAAPPRAALEAETGAKLVNEPLACFGGEAPVAAANLRRDSDQLA